MYYDKHTIFTCRSSSADIWYTFGDSLHSIFGEKFLKKSLHVWKLGVDEDVELCNEYKQRDAIMESYIEKIKGYDPSYKNDGLTLVKQEKGKCYIATAIYGSYDCPQVWTLRRFRDNTLAMTWFGRTFINAYYTVSPPLVKWFGDTCWFKNLWKKPLDIMVDRLNEQGVENTPYHDENYQYFSFRTIRK